MTNEELVAEIQQGINVASNQEQLWNNNRAYVIKCVKKYIGACDNQDFEDYINEGYIGLVTAASKYSTDYGAGFLTYATYYIKSALYRYNGVNTYTVKVPEYLKDRMRRLAAFKEEYIRENNREPKEEEIQKALCISRRSLVHLEKTMLNMRTKSLDDYVSDDGDTRLIDMVSTDESIDELVVGSEYQRELHEELEEALKALDVKTAMLVRCVYYQHNSYPKAAEIFSCSSQNVYERINRGFYRILHSEHRKRLEAFMWDGYRSNPMRLSNYADLEKIDSEGSELLL